MTQLQDAQLTPQIVLEEMNGACDVIARGAGYLAPSPSTSSSDQLEDFQANMGDRVRVDALGNFEVIVLALEGWRDALDSTEASSLAPFRPFRIGGCARPR